MYRAMGVKWLTEAVITLSFKHKENPAPEQYLPSNVVSDWLIE